MVRLNKCGHPVEWSIRLLGQGKRFSYCLGCLIEKVGLTNMEGHTNLYIKHECDKKIVTEPAVKAESKKTTTKPKAKK